MSQTSFSVVAEPLVRATLDTMPAGPALLALARFRYAPKAKFGPAAGPGPVAFVVESGSLVFSAQGNVGLRRAGASGDYQSPPANKEFTVQPGDEVLIPGNVVHAVRNTGSGPATILGAATFPGSGPPKAFPDGVSFVPLVMDTVTTLASAPADYAVHRVTLPSGSRDADVFYSGPGLHYVESGAIELRVGQGEVHVPRDAASGRFDVVSAGQRVQLNQGQGAVVLAGSVASIGNTGASDAAVLSLRTGAAAGATSAATLGAPFIDLRSILPRFVQTVMDGANPDAVFQFLDPAFISHDAVPGRHDDLPPPGKDTPIETARFLKDVIFPSFTGFKTKFQVLIQDGDFVGGQWVQSFQHTGDGYFGVKATQTIVTISGFTIVRVKDGKMTDHWEERDIGSWHRQIGLGFPLGSLGSGTTSAIRSLATSPDKDVVSRYYTAWNRNDAASVTSLLSTDFVNNTLMNGQLAGRTGIIQFMSVMHTALGNCQVVVDLLVGDGGGTVFARVRYSGIHQGTLFGVPATGKPIEVAAIDMFTVRSGQIAARSGQLDESSLAIQMGVLNPPPTGSGG